MQGLSASSRLQRGFLALVAAFVVIMVGGVLVSCGGSSSDTSSNNPSTAGTSNSSSSGESKTSVATPTPTSEADSIAFENLTPIPPPTAEPGSADELLGGTPNYEAAAALSQSLEAIGVPADAMTVYVLPISGTDGSLLVLDLDSDNEAAANMSDQVGQNLLPTLATDPEIEKANITRISMNIHSTDEQGPLTLVVTLPMDTLVGYVNGTVTDDQMALAVKYAVQR